MADPIMLEALNLTKRFRTLQAPMTSISELHSKVFSALPKRAGESTSMTRMIRTTRSTSGEIPLGQPLKSVERGLLAICPQDIVVWSDLTYQQNLALMRNLYDHIRNSKGNPENRIEDLLRRLALARGVGDNAIPSRTHFSPAGSSKRNDEEQRVAMCSGGRA